MLALRKTIPALAVAVAMSVGALSAAQAEDMPGKGKTVKMAQATWDTGWFPAAIYKELIEKLGYDVKGPTTLDNPPFYQAVSQGDIDLWVNGWFPLHNTYEGTFKGKAEKIGYVAKGGALQGYLVDKASAEKYNIKTLDDFKRPEVKKAFDRNGDGKADMVACPPGWGCEVTIDYQMKAYGLNDDINLIKAGYSASMADAVAAHQNGEPILFYTWTPNWTVNVLKPGKDVVWIQVPKVDLPKDQANLKDAATMKGVKGCVADPCVLGWPANDIRPVANDKFLEENPAVKALLKEASIPLKAIFAQNAKMNDGADSKKDIQKQAETWIKNNQDMVNGWLDDARKAASM